MEVTLKHPVKLGNKDYKAGKQSMPDHLSANLKFKSLVKSGDIQVHQRLKNQIEVQAMKDQANAKKAQAARLLTKKLLVEKAAQKA